MWSLIVATSDNGVIGSDGSIPWKLPEDMKHFKEFTINKTVLMGRKTFDSIGKPLPNRRNVVISKNKNLYINGVEVFNSIEHFKEVIPESEQVVVIGGSQIYDYVLDKNLIDEIKLSLVNVISNGDSFFSYDLASSWKIKDYRLFRKDEKNQYDICFITYHKKT